VATSEWRLWLRPLLQERFALLPAAARTPPFPGSPRATEPRRLRFHLRKSERLPAFLTIANHRQLGNAWEPNWTPFGPGHLAINAPDRTETLAVRKVSNPASPSGIDWGRWRV